MARMQFGLSAFERARGDLPSLPVENMWAEKAPTEETGVALQSRPGLADRGANMGSGPILSLFKADGVLLGSLLGVSGHSLYSGTFEIGIVDGSGPFFITGYEDLAFLAGGGSLWSFDGSTLATVAFPDGANVTKVLVGASRAICLRADTEKFYWSDPLTSTIDSLSFASAENQPDRTLDLLFIDDVLIDFGAETVEFWPSTPDADLPFQPLEGRVFESGIKATGCATEFGSTFAWVTNNNQVCLSDPDNIISEPGLEALIEASSHARLQSFFIEGTEFLWLKIDTGDWVYTARWGKWSKFSTYLRTGWLPSCYAGGVFGSSLDGRTMVWGPGHLDLDLPLERRFRAGFPMNAGGMTVSNVVLRANIGETPYLEGDYVSPMVEMRRSLDGGKTFGKWRAVSLGVQGQYRKKVQWTGCGMAGQPGWISEFRCSAPVPFRVSDVLYNVPYGGV